MGQQKHSPLNLRRTATSGGTSSSIETEARFTAQPSAQLGRMARAARNGTLATATSLGTFPPGQRKFKNGLNKNNPTDFYKIELTEKGRIKLALFNRSEAPITSSILDATGRVVSLNGQRLATTASAGTKVETLVKSANPGIYYLRFHGGARKATAYEVNLFVNRLGGPQPLPCGCGE